MSPDDTLAPSPSPQLACGGQPGVKRDGVDQLITLGGLALDGLVAAVTENPAAALAFQIAISGLQFDLSRICSSPDPGDPGLTLQDYVDVADTSNAFASGAAVLRFRQWVIHMLWPSWCNCSDGTPPAPAVSAPLPDVGLNTGAPGGTTGANCWHAENVFHTNSAGTTTDIGALMPPLGTIGSPSPPLPPFTRLPTPVPTSLSVSMTMHNITPAAQLWSWTGQFCDASGALMAAGQINSPSLSGNVTYAGTGTVPTAAAGFRLFEQGPNPPALGPTVDATLEFFCGSNTSTTTIVPCCPPDPSLDVRLRNIEQLERIIIQLLGEPLLSHTDGTRHSGLMNSGSIVLVDSVTAIRVEVTSSLTGWPANPGVPTYFFSLGFITSIALESPLKGWRLVYGSQTFPIVPYADSVGYTLPPGVMIDIVELLPKAA